MNRLRGLARSALARAVATTTARRRSVVALVAVPLAIAFAGVALGVGAESGGWGVAAILASIPLALLAGGASGGRFCEQRDRCSVLTAGCGWGESRAAPAHGLGRRSRASQPARPHDRAQASVRGLHHEVQPRAQARRTRGARTDRHGRPHAPLPPRGASGSKAMPGSRGCSRTSRSRSGATTTLRSRSARRTRSSPPRGGRRTSPTRRSARSNARGSCT